MLNHDQKDGILPEIVLASGSPRRSEILASVGWSFVKDVPEIDESLREGETPEAYVERLAVEKAAAIAGQWPGRVVLGADTTVVLGGEVIGKPADMDDARRMIRLLSGEVHDVITGVALVRDSTAVSGIQRTAVTFAEMSEAEIEFLALEGDPLDKAGAYAVQAQAALFIRGISGDYWNVVGLPINLVYELYRGFEAAIGEKA
ncbi:MAG: septum formation protein Maf [Acidobacteria bacterium]|nr:septum formation protein Maf [Acidobacteriota bacterium]